MADSLILYSSDDFVVADKPHGLPTVPLKGQSPEGTLLGLVAALFPDVMDITGKIAWEGGAVHRLDTATGGLVVFARTQAFYEHIQQAQTKGLFSKTYMAKTTCSDRLKGLDASFDGQGRMEISSYFRSFGPGRKEVRPTLDIKRADSDVLYTTRVKRIQDNVFECTIERGFRHQIRAHLAWIGHPIAGDPLYSPGGGSQTLELECTSLSFPTSGAKTFTFGK